MNRTDFCSILYSNKSIQENNEEEPECFKDIGFDNFFSSFSNTQNKIKSVFYTPLKSKDEIIFRQEILKDIESNQEFFTNFTNKINSISSDVFSINKYFLDNGKRLSYVEKGKLFACAENFCNLICELNNDECKSSFHSEGIKNFLSYISDYCGSNFFVAFKTEIKNIRDEFNKIKYCLLINNGTVKIRKYENQNNFSNKIISLFERFSSGEAKDYKEKFTCATHADHVEEAIFLMLSKIYKEEFLHLNQFCQKYFEFEDKTILNVADELSFYLFYLDEISPLKKAGLNFCYPTASEESDSYFANDTFDIVLAKKQDGKVIVNNFELNTPERVIVITGPNQGGKTTFARMFAQINWLSSLGLSVPGTKASLKIFNNIYTLFQKQEDSSLENGKLKDELIRLHSICDKLDSKSIVIINEIFASTTTSDSVELGKMMMKKLIQSGALAVVVTFLDELAKCGPEVVSMMSTVNKDDTSQRTYKILRKAPDGLAYAIQIAKKYNLTYEDLNRRLSK